MEFFPKNMTRDFIPEEYRHLRIPIAEVSTVTHGMVTLISQVIRLKNFKVNFHIFDAKQFGEVRPQTENCDCLTIHYMLKGNIDAVLRKGRKVELKENEYNMFQLPRHKHFAVLQPGVYWCFHIDLLPPVQQILQQDLFMFNYFQQSYMKTGGIINLQPCSISGSESLLIHKILGFKDTGISAERKLEKIVQELVLEFTNVYNDQIEGLFKRTVSEQQLAHLSALRMHLVENIAESHDLKKVALKFRLNPGMMSELYEEVFGYTFEEYYHNERLARCYSMLANPSLSFVTIAESLGYKDTKELQLGFRDWFGRSMEEVRKMHLNEGQ